MFTHPTALAPALSEAKDVAPSTLSGNRGPGPRKHSRPPAGQQTSRWRDHELGVAQPEIGLSASLCGRLDQPGLG